MTPEEDIAADYWAEMTAGYRDGYNLDNPEPSDNRSASYRHGFKVGRNDVLPEDQKPFRFKSAAQLRALAALAVEQDCELAAQMRILE